MEEEYSTEDTESMEEIGSGIIEEMRKFLGTETKEDEIKYLKNCLENLKPIIKSLDNFLQKENSRTGPPTYLPDDLCDAVNHYRKIKHLKQKEMEQKAEKNLKDSHGLTQQEIKNLNVLIRLLRIDCNIVEEKTRQTD